MDVNNRLYDCLTFCVFLFGGVFLLWYEACHVLPSYDPETVQFRSFHFVVAAWLAFSIYGNMYKLKTTNIVYRKQQDTQIVTKDWKRCDICGFDTPPRSHHCKICNTCIMKRDHHCWFAASCIGYQNHRYYVVMVTYMVIAGVYCNVFNAKFVTNVKGGFGILDILWFLGPHVGWLFGYLDNYGFCITLLSTVGFIITLLFIWLLKIQVTQIRHGQTKYERSAGIFMYALSLSWNIQEVLGEKSFLVFLSPFIDSPLPGDGTVFSTRERKHR